MIQTWWKKITRFASVGALGVGVNLLVYALLSLVISPLLAAAVSFVVAATCNALLYHQIVWLQQPAKSSMARSLGTSSVVLACNLGLLQIGLMAGTNHMVAQMIAIAATMPLNFLLHQYWVFSQGQQQEQDVAAALPDTAMLRNNIA